MGCFDWKTLILIMLLIWEPSSPSMVTAEFLIWTLDFSDLDSRNLLTSYFWALAAGCLLPSSFWFLPSSWLESSWVGNHRWIVRWKAQCHRHTDEFFIDKISSVRKLNTNVKTNAISGSMGLVEDLRQFIASVRSPGVYIWGKLETTSTQ